MKNKIKVIVPSGPGNQVNMKIREALVTAVSPGVPEQKMDIYGDGFHIQLSDSALVQVLQLARLFVNTYGLQ